MLLHFPRESSCAQVVAPSFAAVRQTSRVNACGFEPETHIRRGMKQFERASFMSKQCRAFDDHRSNYGHMLFGARLYGRTSDMLFCVHVCSCGCACVRECLYPLRLRFAGQCGSNSEASRVWACVGLYRSRVRLGKTVVCFLGACERFSFLLFQNLGECSPFPLPPSKSPLARATRRNAQVLFFLIFGNPQAGHQ